MKNFSLLSTIFLTMALCVSGNTIAEEAQKSLWVVTSLDQVEAPAKAVILEIAGGNQLDSVKTRQANGIKLYKAIWRENGVENRASVTAKGEVNTINRDLAPNEVPEKIKKLAQAHFGAGKEITYETETRVIYQTNPEGTKDFFRVTPIGRVYTQEKAYDENGKKVERTTIAVDQIPATALDFLKKFAGKNTIDGAFMRKDAKDGNTYGIEWTKNGTTYAAVVMEDGTLMKLEEDLTTEDQLPEGVKAANKKHYTKGEKLEYQKEIVTIYDIRPPEAIGVEKGHFRLTLNGKKVELGLSDEMSK